MVAVPIAALVCDKYAEGLWCRSSPARLGACENEHRRCLRGKESVADCGYCSEVRVAAGRRKTVSSTWPWSLDTDAVLRAKFHTAAELAIIFEKLVHQISLVKEALPEIRESGSELTAIMIRQARLAIERLTAEFVPGSLLNDNSSGQHLPLPW